MTPRVFESCDTKELDITEEDKVHDLYQIFTEVDDDLADAGLGMPSTFADHLMRINSKSATVRAEEKAWFESIIKSTHSLTKDQFREKDDTPEYGSSQQTVATSAPAAPAAATDIFPTFFMNQDPVAIPRMRPYRYIQMPHFPLDNVKAPRLQFGYTTAQLFHCLRIIASVSPWDTMHDSSANRQGDCIRRLHKGRPGLTVDQVCPDLAPGVICGECDAEGFCLANYILAKSGYSGRSNIDTIPNIQLKKQVASTLTSPIRVPFEEMILAFGAKSYACNEDINGTEQQAWIFLKKRTKKAFKRFESWSPTTPTKAAHKLEVARLADLAAAAAAALERENQ